MRGVATEREERNLLTYTTDSRLELDTPLGVARFAVLRLTLQPAAKGWHITGVDVLPPDQWATASPQTAGGNGEGGTERSLAELPPAWRRPLAALADAAAYGTPFLSPDSGTEISGAAAEGMGPLDVRVDVLLDEMVEAGEQLRSHGFTLTPLPAAVTPLDESTYRQIAPPTWQPPSGETAYFDVVLRWDVQGPEGERLTIERRLWVALKG